MTQYIARRILLLIPTMFLVSLVVFFSVRLLPGDVVDVQASQAAVAGGGTTEQERERIREELGLNEPAVKQYFVWIGNVLRGDLGDSLFFKNSVWSELGRAIPVSLELAVIAVVISILIAIPMGSLAAIYQDSPIDYGTRFISVLGLSVPDFVVGTVFIVLVAIWFNWSPPFGYSAFLDDPRRNLVQFLVPGAILGLRSTSTTLRMVRSSMLEVLRSDYIRTAHAKGLSDRMVIVRHALKNSMIAPMTLIGTQIGFLIGGTFVIEQIFTLPGVGLLTLDSVNNRDYTQLQGSVLFLSTVFVMINLLIDLSYAWLDPRIRYS